MMALQNINKQMPGCHILIMKKITNTSTKKDYKQLFLNPDFFPVHLAGNVTKGRYWSALTITQIR